MTSVYTCIWFRVSKHEYCVKFILMFISLLTTKSTPLNTNIYVVRSHKEILYKKILKREDLKKNIFEDVE